MDGWMSRFCFITAFRGVQMSSLILPERAKKSVRGARSD
jgi:hypothetical protein